MPRGDGTGPMGGGGRGMGRGGGGFGAGPAGVCVCPSCNTRASHTRGIPCTFMTPATTLLAEFDKKCRHFSFENGSTVLL